MKTLKKHTQRRLRRSYQLARDGWTCDKHHMSTGLPPETDLVLHQEIRTEGIGVSILKCDRK